MQVRRASVTHRLLGAHNDAHLHSRTGHAANSDYVGRWIAQPLVPGMDVTAPWPQPREGASMSAWALDGSSEPGGDNSDNIVVMFGGVVQPQDGGELSTHTHALNPLNAEPLSLLQGHCCPVMSCGCYSWIHVVAWTRTTQLIMIINSSITRWWLNRHHH